MRYDSILDTIGHTPLVEVPHISPNNKVRIFAKLEGQNPTGSVKDRIAKYMLDGAVRSGQLTKDKTILEATSGNTGISLAMIAQLQGYKLKVVMPENVTQERVQLLEAFGTEIVFTEGSKGTNGAIERAQEIVRDDERYFMPDQYANSANPLAHYETTGAEILEEVPQIDAFIAGLGTGGTLMGAGRRLKEHNPRTKVIAVVPHPGDQIQGLRRLEEGFIPPIVDLSLLDGRMVVNSKDAFLATKYLTQKEGILAGISSGAVIYAAIRIAERMDEGNIVVLLADGGWKYLSTGLWTRDIAELEEDIAGKIWW
ncbi:MAG: cysteine synthase family protein [Dehalococcoidia bacterium]